MHYCHDPQARRVLGDVEVQDSSPIVADEEKAVKRAERNSWDHACPN
jgi:hypothetical protein